MAVTDIPAAFPFAVILAGASDNLGLSVNN
jgi:hypothetical protein